MNFEKPEWFKGKLEEPDMEYSRRWILHMMKDDSNIVEAVRDFVDYHEIENINLKLLKEYLDPDIFKTFKRAAISGGYANSEEDDAQIPDELNDHFY